MSKRFRYFFCLASLFYRYSTGTKTPSKCYFFCLQRYANFYSWTAYLFFFFLTLFFERLSWPYLTFIFHFLYYYPFFLFFLVLSQFTILSFSLFILTPFLGTLPTNISKLLFR
jgi:hypothetical protein